MLNSCPNHLFSDFILKISNMYHSWFHPSSLSPQRPSTSSSLSLPTVPPVFSVPQSMAFRLVLDLQRHNAALSHFLYPHSNPKAHIASVALFLGMKPCCCSLFISLASAISHNFTVGSSQPHHHNFLKIFPSVITCASLSIIPLTTILCSLS